MKTLNELKLLKQKRWRDEKGLFLAEGERLISEIPPYLITAFYVSRTYAGEHKPQIAAADSPPVYILKDSLYQSLSLNKSGQGRIALCKKPPAPVLKTAADGFFVLCDRVQDPGNVGAIIRSAHAFGAAGVYLSAGCADAYNPKTLQAGAGGVFHVPVFENSDLAATATELKTHGVCVAAAAAQGGEPAERGILHKPFAIIIGNEANGISTELITLADRRVYIPMPGGAQSLNAACAAAVLIYIFF